jgi:hypothetical protein
MTLKTLTVSEVKAIHEREAERYAGEDLVKATRVEVHAELQTRNPPPLSDFPKHVEKDRRAPVDANERVQIQRHQRAQVTDAQHIAFSKIRAEHPYILDGHHYVQWEHGKALWTETDKLLAAAGIGGAK